MAATRVGKKNIFSDAMKESISNPQTINPEKENPTSSIEMNQGLILVQPISKRTKHKDKAVSLKVNSNTWETFKRYAELNGSTANGMLTQLIASYNFEQKKKFG